MLVFFVYSLPRGAGAFCGLLFRSSTLLYQLWLFNADNNLRFYRLILDWDMKWHCTPPFFLFFHSDTQLSTSRARIVNIFSGAIYRFIRQNLQFRLVTAGFLFRKIAFHDSIF